MPSRRTTSRTWASISSTAPSQPDRRAASLSAVIALPVASRPATPRSPCATILSTRGHPAPLAHGGLWITVPRQRLTERIHAAARGPQSCTLLQSSAVDQRVLEGVPAGPVEVRAELDRLTV